jgi:multicomponent Na+:H+ antiporter subunit C
MILLISLTIAVIFGCGFYLLLKKGLMNRALGLLLISNGANFVIISMAGTDPHPLPPLLQQGATSGYADPLPQALILTALVIGFAVAAFLWALVLRLGKEEQ